MQMHMHYLLPPFLSDIELKFVSWNIHPMSEITSEKKQSSNRILIRISHQRNSRNMSLRYKEHMNMGFRVQIIDHYVVFVFVYGSGRNFMSDNGTEKTHKNTVKR